MAWSALLATSCNIVLQEHSRQLSRFQWFTKNQDEPLLVRFGDLYKGFLKRELNIPQIEDLGAQFETCIGRVESQGLIRRLGFGDLVLLQPEILDAYLSALINAVRDEPDGLGSIAEEQVRRGAFPLPEQERIPDRELEKLLLIAMIEDLFRYEIALREQGDDGPYLVFPSESTRTNPDLPNPEGKAVIFRFEGPIQNIYATLAVRLSHSGLFVKKDLWKNAATYTTKMGGIYGMFLRNIGDGRGELTLFFDKAAREELSFHFEEFVYVHLQRRALPESLKRQRIFACQACGTLVTEEIVELRRGRGFNWLNCPVCKNLVPSRSASVFPILSNPPLSTCSSYAPHKSSCRTSDLDHSLLHVQLVERPEFLESFAKIGRAPTNKDCGSFFFVRRSPNTLTPAFFPSPLTAKLTAKPVDNSGFP